MDDRLQKALEFANYRQTLNNQLQKIKIKSQGLLMFSKNGGSFQIDHSLIGFLDYLVRSDTTSAVILDTNNNPIKIDDVKQFLNEVSERYREVTTDYLQEYTDIRKSRNVKSILDIEDAE